jgi:PAS domain S-box-containing protein
VSRSVDDDMPEAIGALSNSELQERLREAEETLDAIRNGDVDAVVVGGPAGRQVYTLENADRPYRVLIEEMQEGAITLGDDGTILYCNQRFASLSGERRESIIGASIARYFSKTQFAAFNRLMAHGRFNDVASSEFMLRALDGREIPVNISLVDLKVADGGAPLTCGVVTDLTNNRQRSHELAAANLLLANEIEERRRAEESLRLALEAVGMGSWDLDLSTGDIRRSAGHDRIFGHAGVRRGWNLQATLDHFIAEDRDAVARAFKSALTQGVIEIEARIRTPNETQTRLLQIKGKTYYDAGKPIRIAGVLVDVTERRALEEQLRQAQKIEAIGRLTGGVAHDFNNLLMVISGGLEMLERQKDPARRERVMSGMRLAVERGSGLSRQLLAFSRSQALKPEPIDLTRVIGGMQSLLDRSLRGDVFVNTEFASNLWPVEVDPSELELVVLNLAVNARDAMPNGGTIVIRAENAASLRDGELAGDFVRLSVIDEGTGMSPEVLARVFEPFFTTKEVGKGSGLGLAQAHGFARASGGGVRIKSAVGNGTTLSLLLPKTNKTPAAAEEAAPDAPNGRAVQGSAGNILLVEDDDEVAALTAEMIETLGYGIVRVASAEAALGALANDRAIDIVFSDVMMPGAMNGIMLAREIARRRPSLPIVLTSGYAGRPGAVADDDQVDILPKPYRLDDLSKAFTAARQASRLSMNGHARSHE